jgi:hypothetical protein
MMGDFGMGRIRRRALRGGHQRREHGMTSKNHYLRASLLLAGGLAMAGLVLGACGGEATGPEDELGDATLASGSEELVSNPLTPLLTCMDNLGGNKYKAHFGYNNTSSKSVRVPVGLLNFFVPLPQNQGQPIDFAAGNHPDVFKVTFSTKDGWDRLAWWLSGRRALATQRTPLCAPPPPQCTSNTDCDDDNPCTTNTCSSGHCVTAPAPPRTACGHAGLCDNAGACVSCLTASDCDDTKACTNDVCTAGACTHPPTPLGTPCGHQGQCDGAGLCGAPACVIDTDCDDGDSCTTDSCGTGGVCGHTPAPPRTACGHAGLCDNTGLCVSCLTAADCDDAKVCTEDVCTAGACTHPPTSAGTTCGHAGHCDGAGLCGL